MKYIVKGIGDHLGITDQSDFDPKICSVRIAVDIGPELEGGVNFFYIQVVTYAYLTYSKKPTWGKHLLIVDLFCWEEIEQIIKDLVIGISSEDWAEFTRILTQYMEWEYDDMQI